MEFKIEKAALLQGLYLAQGISDRKSTMPILANVLLAHRWQRQAARRCHRSERHRHRRARRARSMHEGGLTVGAKHLHDIVKSLPGDELTLKRTENQYAEIRAGKVDYKVVGMADRDFPKLPNHREVKFAKVDAATLRDMIAKTFFSISTDETRYHLNGVLFESRRRRRRAWCRPTATACRRWSGRSRAGRSWRRASSSRARASWRCAARSRRPRARSSSASTTGTSSCAWATTALVGQAHRRAVPALRAGHPEGERQGRRSRRAWRSSRRSSASASCRRTRPGASSSRVAKGELQGRQRQPRPRRGARGRSTSATTARR